MESYSPRITLIADEKGLPETTKKLEKMGYAIQNISQRANGMYAVSGKLASELNKQAGATDKAGAAAERASLRQRNYALHIANTTIQSALVNKAFLALTDSMAKAVQQTDLIGNFPSVMGAMGIATDDSSEAMNKLRGYVQGVGGDLAAATSSVSRFAQINKDVKSSVAMYAGVNNAIIAGGANAETAAASLEQLVQGYSRGRFEGEEFRSMQTSMNLALNETARALNLPNSQALQAALTEGEISMNQFMAKLAEVSTGTGPVAQAAMAQMNGIGFAMTMLKNTVTNSLTAIYQAVGRQNIAAVFGFITQVIQVLASWVVTLINLLRTLFNFISGLFGGPQLKKVEGDTAGVANNLGVAADNAGDVGKGLDGAGKSAKKLNKQLASFDKMNVLAEKDTSGAGGGGGGGGAGGGAGGANMGDLKGLDGIFDGLEGKLQKAGLAAKIFAGVLASLAGLKFAQGIINQIDGVAKSFQKARTGLGAFKKALVGGMDENGEKVDGFAQKVAKVPLIIGKIPKLPLNPIVLGLAAVTIGLGILYAKSEDFKKGFDKSFGAVFNVIKKVYEWVMFKLVAAWETLKVEVDKFAKALDLKVPQWLKDLIVDLGLAEGEMESFGAGVGIVAGALALIAAAPLLLIVGVIAVIVGLFVGLVLIIQEIGDFLAEVIWNVVLWFQQGWENIQGHWANVTLFFSELWEGIKTVFAEVGGWFSGKFQAAWTGIVNIWNKVTGWFGKVWDGIKEFFKPVTDWFKEKFQGAWDGIKIIWDKVVAFFEKVWLGIKLVYGPIITWFKEKFQGAWDNIKKVWDKVSGWFGTLWGEIKKVFSNPGAYFKEKFQAAWDNVTRIWSKVKTWFGDRWNDIKGVFSWEKVKTLGKNIVEGLWNGINNMVGWIKGKISNFGSNVLQGLKDFFKIKSPSRVMRDEVGKMLGLGLAEGIVNSTKEVVGAAEDTANSVVDAFSGMYSDMGKLESDFNINGTLSNVTGDLNTIDSGDYTPHDSSADWADKILAGSASGDSRPIQIVVQIGEDQITDKIINLINDKTQMSGRTVLRV